MSRRRTRNFQQTQRPLETYRFHHLTPVSFFKLPVIQWCKAFALLTSFAVFGPTLDLGTKLLPNPAYDTRLVGMEEVMWATDGSVARPPPPLHKRSSGIGIAGPLLCSLAFPDVYTDIPAAELYAIATACWADDMYRNKTPQCPRKSTMFADY